MKKPRITQQGAVVINHVVLVQHTKHSRIYSIDFRSKWPQVMFHMLPGDNFDVEQVGFGLTDQTLHWDPERANLDTIVEVDKPDGWHCESWANRYSGGIIVWRENVNKISKRDLIIKTPKSVEKRLVHGHGSGDEIGLQG